MLSIIIEETNTKRVKNIGNKIIFSK